MAGPVATLFTYQGRLNTSSGLANGSFDFQFEIYDGALGGLRLGVVTNGTVAVSNGVFTAAIDFGSGIFTGEGRWLQISVRTNGSSDFTLLTPRQMLTAVPYAMNAGIANTVAANHLIGTVPESLLSSNVALLNKGQVFTGPTLFQGPVTLTNPSNLLTGQFLGSGLNTSNLPPFATVLTTNSTFSEIKAALVRGGLIWFQPGHYWSIDNLSLSNAAVILGWNAVLHAKSGMTNFLIDTDLKAENICIYGLSVCGDRNIVYDAPGLVLTPLPAPYYQTILANHGGMRLNMASGGTIAGCSASGFGGHGFMLISRNQSSAEGLVGSFFHDNHSYSNGVGVAVLGTSYEYPGSPWAALSVWTNEVTAEHQLISGNEIFKNCIGLYAPAGNCLVIGNKITANNYGVVLMGGPNDTHGEVVANTLNHNIYGIVASHMKGEVIRQNLLLDVGTVFIDSVSYLVFEGNQLAGVPRMDISITNSFPSPFSNITLANNIYHGAWGSEVVVTTNLYAGGMTTVYGNRSITVPGDTDGSTISQMQIGAGLTTNFALPTGATLYITNGQIMKIQ